MLLTGVTVGQAPQIFITAICGQETMSKGQLVRAATASDDLSGANVGTVTDNPGDGTSIMWCMNDSSTVGILAENAVRGEVCRVLVYGFCDSVMVYDAAEGDVLVPTGNVPTMTGVARGDLAGEIPYGTALTDAVSNVVTKAWVNFM